MASEHMLNNLLQRFQDVHDLETTEKIIGTTTHLLTELSNPRNLGILTSQLLSSPAIWHRHQGLRTSFRIISIYNTAAIRVRERELDDASTRGSGLRADQWARAVVTGADDRSKRWQHLLVLTGILIGMESNDRRALSRSLRNTVEHAVVTAANLALAADAQDDPLAAPSIVLALSFAFPLLSDYNRTSVNCNRLLPVVVRAMAEREGFGNGQFLHNIQRDVLVTPSGALVWASKAPSFLQMQEMDRQPLMGNMAPLYKLGVFAAQNATDTRLVLEAHSTLLAFTCNVLEGWGTTQFSNVEPALENARLSPETLQGTWQPLWSVLRKMFYGVVAILQAITGRSLLDPHMRDDRVAPEVAAKSLHALRNLFFISSRNNDSSFPAYRFTYLTSLDVISRNAGASEALLRDTRPAENLTAPATHLQQSLDLFHLNVSEHLPGILSTSVCDDLIIKPATQYLESQGAMSPFMVELFESAHSAILAVLSYPKHSQLTIQLAPFYIVKLLSSFPTQISSRQFRVAFTSVMQIVSPPFPIAAMEPHLSETLLEMLRSQTVKASTGLLPSSPDTVSKASDSTNAVEEPMSEQSSLILALIDALPFLPLPLVEEWLTVAAQALNEIADPRTREPVRKRLWSLLVSGEMDVERAAIGVAWWGTKGGRDLVMNGGHEAPMMSGALVGDTENSKL